MTIELQISEVTARTGLTPKALRLYEAKGLIKPIRSACERRVYREAEFIQLQRIVTLKRLGLSLRQIAEVLRDGEVDAMRLLGLQLQCIDVERQRLARLNKTLKKGLERVVEGHTLTVDELCSLIKLSEAEVDTKRFAELLNRWFDPDEQARWKAISARCGNNGANMPKGWEALILRAEQAVESGIAPDAPAAMRLAVEWAAKLKPLASQMDRNLWNRGAAMFQAIADGEETPVGPPKAQRVYAFIFAAVGAARRNGLIAENSYQ